MIRTSTQQRIVGTFVEMMTDIEIQPETSLVNYLLYAGMSHLIAEGEIELARQRLTTPLFFAKYTKRHSTYVTPWVSMRLVGVDEVLEGLQDCFRSIRSKPLNLDVVSTWYSVAFHIGEVLPNTPFLVDLWEWIVAQRREHLPNSTELSKAIRNLTHIYSENKRYTEALQVIEAQLEQLHAADPPNELEIAAALNMQGGVLLDLDRYSEAKHAYERSLTIRKEQLGSDHINTMITLDNIATVEWKLGDSLNIQSHIENAFQMVEYYGENHPQGIVSISNLGHMLRDSGDEPSALTQFQKVMEYRRKVFGMSHRSTAFATYDVANSLFTQKRFLEANAHYELVLPLFQQYQYWQDFMVALNNYSWSILEVRGGIPTDNFATLIEYWDDPTVWLHQWVTFGHGLCLALTHTDVDILNQTKLKALEYFHDDPSRSEKILHYSQLVLASLE